MSAQCSRCRPRMPRSGPRRARPRSPRARRSPRKTSPCSWTTSSIITARCPTARGKAIVLNVCTMCHDLSRIRRGHRSPEEWEETLNAMLNEGAPLSDDQFPIVHAYLSRNFGVRVIPAADALERLREGNLRFASDVTSHAGTGFRIAASRDRAQSGAVRGHPRLLRFTRAGGDRVRSGARRSVRHPRRRQHRGAVADRQRGVRRGARRGAARRGAGPLALRRHPGHARGAGAAVERAVAQPPIDRRADPAGHRADPAVADHADRRRAHPPRRARQRQGVGEPSPSRFGRSRTPDSDRRPGDRRRRGTASKPASSNSSTASNLPIPCARLE